MRRIEFNPRNRNATIKTLIEIGADVNEIDNDGYNALMHAASGLTFRFVSEDDQLKLCKMLIDAGTDLSHINKRGDDIKVIMKKHSVIIE